MPAFRSVQRLLGVRSPFTLGFALLVLFGVLYALARVVDVVLLGFLAILVGTLLSYPIDWLSRAVPRGVAVVLTLFSVIGGAVLLVWLFAPTVSNEANALATQIPSAVDRMEAWITTESPLASLPQGASIAEHLRQKEITELATLISGAVPFALGVAEIVTLLVLLLALALFCAYEPRAYHAGIRALTPRRYEPILDETWHRVGTTLRAWVGGILLAMIIMGSLTALALWIAGFDAWLMLGLLTCFGTFIPYAGAIASAIPGLAVGLAMSPLHFLYACAIYLGVHFVEGYLVQPLIMRRAVELRPATLLFFQMLMGALFGLPGVVTATPLLACLKVAVRYLWIERVLEKPGDMAPNGA
jgi:predicted PurR-regulated permease PerM